MQQKIKVIVLGCGNMGSSHARAYNQLDGFELVGLIDRSETNRSKLANELGGIGQFNSLQDALDATNPDAAAICTYPDTHYLFSKTCLEAGLHVFTEKPIAETVDQARELVSLAARNNKKIVVGYILRVHPAWTKFVEIAQTLGKPLVMRMNLNQQSKGKEWETHKNLMQSMSPIVDCGVHYVDIMCQMTRSKPIRVSGVGANLTKEISPKMYNYGQLQVVFEDLSVGWYEAGWGPMISEVAFFVKDVIGPKGSVSIVEPLDSEKTASSDIDSHTKTNSLLVHHAETDISGEFTKNDIRIDTSDEPDHQELCNREQAFFYKAMQENLDLTEHLEDAVNSLRIVLAADESIKTGRVVQL
jgi:predicted dehydrogenase